MKRSYNSIGDFRIEGRFTIGSGIITTTPTTMLKFAKECKPLGIITSKSIGLKPTKGEPALNVTQLDNSTILNSVSLSNPGIDAYVEEMKIIKEEWPENKFLSTSIFGTNEQEWSLVAKYAQGVSDGLELNFGCPHSEDLCQIGKDPDLVERLTGKVVDSVNIPVLVKLPPSENISEVAKAAETAGASGIVAVNTVGPEKTDLLFSGKGSRSGPSIKEIGLECVKEIARTVDLPLIGIGGILNLDDIILYEKAGADFFGFGSSLIHMPTIEIMDHLLKVNNARADAEYYFAPDHKIEFKKQEKVMINEIIECSDDLRIFVLNSYMASYTPGQFMMIQPEGKEAKPFSIADHNLLTFAVKKVGESTSAMFKLDVGDYLKISGPFGNLLNGEYFDNKPVYLVGGGTGIAPLHMIAKFLHNPKKLKKTTKSIIGAQTKNELIFLDELKEYSSLVYSTDDGSAGREGTVIGLLETNLRLNAPKRATFVNCGPEKMIEKAVKLERKYVESPIIYCATERYTPCGTGLCGKCEINGLRCVDGPIYWIDDIEDALGVYKRDETGKRINF